MESKEKNTKEKILEEALKLFAQSGYMGTSMNDIASKLGVTKAALYKHYKSKQEILDSIIEKMKELDIERAKQYEMPEGDLEKVTAEYKEMAFDKIKQFTKVQFLHWTEEEFSSCFRKMLTLEQYREPQMAPQKPLQAPCTMKMRSMLPRFIPMVRKMATSPCLSSTTITSAERILNAATMTISTSIRLMMCFSMATA